MTIISSSLIQDL